MRTRHHRRRRDRRKQQPDGRKTPWIASHIRGGFGDSGFWGCQQLLVELVIGSFYRLAPGPRGRILASSRKVGQEIRCSPRKTHFARPRIFSSGVFQKFTALRLHITKCAVQLLAPRRWRAVVWSFTEITGMKRLLILAAVALLTASATGCECGGMGNWGLCRSRRNNCSPCDTCNPCSSRGVMMPSSGCGCGCGGGAVIDGMPIVPAPIINAPTIAPTAESYTLSHRSSS